MRVGWGRRGMDKGAKRAQGMHNVEASFFCVLPLPAENDPLGQQEGGGGSKKLFEKIPPAKPRCTKFGAGFAAPPPAVVCCGWLVRQPTHP